MYNLAASDIFQMQVVCTFFFLLLRTETLLCQNSDPGISLQRVPRKAYPDSGRQLLSAILINANSLHLY